MPAIRHILFFVLFSAKLFPQASKIDTVYIYVELIKTDGFSYSISEENLGASFTFYRKGFETEEKRNAKAKEYKNNKTQYAVKPNSAGWTPTEYYSYTSMKAPEKLESVCGIDFITIEEFREYELDYIYSRNTYIVHKSKQGGFLKWKVNMMMRE